MQQQHNIETPEFWEQVKAEYVGMRYICDACSSFKDFWREEKCKKKIRKYAKEFIDTLGEYQYQMGCQEILFNYYQATKHQDMAIRRAFIDYMIKKTTSQHARH